MCDRHQLKSSHTSQKPFWLKLSRAVRNLVWFLFESQMRRIFMVRKGWTAMDVPSGWVQILRGPRPPSQRWPQSQKPAIRRWRNHQSQENKVLALHQARVGPAAARDLANKIVQLERAVEAMGSMEGLAVQAIKLELEKARSASKKPPFNVEIEEARKFMTRSMRRLKEWKKSVGWRTFVVEAQENLKKMWAEQERVPATQHRHRT